jgi:DHA3 family macrolide efflux protein-like MFS transporter
LLQEKVDPNYMGRIFGIFGMISTSMMPIGMLIFGPLSDIVEIEWLLVGTGLLIVVLALFFVGNKQLIHAGLPATKEAAQE